MEKQREGGRGVCKIMELPSVILIVLVFPLIFKSQLSAGNVIAEITPGAIIKLNTSLISSEGTFAAGLRQIGQKVYGFALWYAGVPDKTIVWLANRNRLVAEDAYVTLSKDGDLQLYDSTEVMVWNSNTSRVGVVHAVMNDTGNLVLLTENGTIVWESFQSPTNTLLPNQHLTGDMMLVSNRSSANSSLGYYYLFFNDTTLYLSYNGKNDPYWKQQADNMASTNLSDAGFFLNSSGSVSLQAKSYTSSDFGPTSVLRRVTLDVDGNLRIYSWDSTSGTWLAGWRAVMTQCTVHGLCGPNGICRYCPELACSCPPGFHMVGDDNQGGWFKGCARNVSLQCSGRNATTSNKLIVLENTDFDQNDLQYKAGLTKESCVEACQKNCSCLAVAYRYDGSGGCWMKGRKEGYLLNGFHSPESPNTMFLKLSIDDTTVTSPPSLPTSLNLTCPLLPSPPDEKRRDLWSPGVPNILLISFAELACLTIAWWFLKLRKIKRRRFQRQKFRSDAIPGLLARFTFKELQSATQNFSQKLGEGAFGSVYKGVLFDKREVAVKRLLRVSEGENEFRAEVATIGMIHHKNLVRLIGYCEEKERRCLVYEYMSNGSLDKHLFNVDATTDGEATLLHLDWDSRFQIILGTARAIAYLHEACHDQILHCDIKPHNILLDRNLQAKVSDFGLAKLMDRDRALEISAIRGTRGYLAPEWVRNAPITAKADVYSFGLVLLEIVRGRRNYEDDYSEEAAAARATSVQSGDEEGTPSWFLLRQLKNAAAAGDMEKVVDGRLEEGGVKWGEVQASIKAALWCLENEGGQRPTMESVVQILEGSMRGAVTEGPPPPPLGLVDGQLNLEIGAEVVEEEE